MSTLSYTSRGVLEFTRIDRIDWHGMPEYKKYPIKSDDADWAVMWFIHGIPFRDCDGCDHYPTTLIVTSPILNIHHEFTKDEVLEMWDKSVFEKRMCLHQILDVVCPEWRTNNNCIPD